MEKFFGGSPLMVLLRLVVISLIVGVVMAAFNLDALSLVHKLRDLVRYAYDLGFDAFAWAGNYFLLGAVIVFPIWAVMRFFAIATDKTTKN